MRLRGLDVTGVPQCHLQFFPSSKGCQMLENMALPENRWITSGCFCLLTTSKYVSALNQVWNSKQQKYQSPEPCAVGPHETVLYEGQTGGGSAHTWPVFQRRNSISRPWHWQDKYPGHSCTLLIHLREACEGKWQSRLNLPSTLVSTLTPMPLHPADTLSG